jgi:zinc transport system substrate-binding protein
LRLKVFSIIIFLFFANILFAADKLNVTVSILPQKYFVKKIAGNLANINVMVLPGNNPATYEPKPFQMLDLSKSKIYFSIGVPFEKVWLKKIISTNPNMLLVKTQKNIIKKPMVERDVHVESQILDPHIWLSPKLVKIQAKNILDGFLKIDEKHKDIYMENYKKFIKEIEDTDSKIKDTLSNLKNRKFMVFHPTWGYFADEYNLEQIPIEVEGKTPSMQTLAKLINKAKKDNIKVVFVQPQFSKKSAEIIAKQIGGKVIAVDPLAENWSENLISVSKVFKKVLNN